MERAAFDTFIMCLRMIQSTACVVLNVLTIICVVKYRSLWNPAGVLVTSLAMTDTLHGLIMYSMPFRNQDRSICTSSLTAETITLYAQGLTFLLVAMERRNTLLTQLNRSKKWLVRNVIVVVIVSWVVIATVHVTWAIWSTPKNPMENSCTNKNTFPKSHIYVNYIYFAVVTLAIAALYGCIAKVVHSSSAQVASNAPPTEQERQQLRAALRITKMMALVVGVFFVLYIPMVISFAFHKESPPFWQYVLHKLSISVVDVNFWINPAIYAWRNKKFREAFQQLFSGCCGRCNNSVGPVNILPQQINIQTVTVGSTEPKPSTSNALEPRRDRMVKVEDLPEVC